MTQIVSAAKWVGLGLLPALLALWIWWGFIGAGVGVFWLILAAFWHWLPVAAAFACVKASRTRGWAGIFLALETVLVVWTLGLWIDSLGVYSRLPPIEYVFNLYLFPAVQLGVLLVVLGLAMTFGWRAREGWRND
jgi:hypothetical protein